MSAVPQHMAALELGNRLRLEGANLRQEVRAKSLAEGLIATADLLVDPPAGFRSLRLRLVLKTPRRLSWPVAMRMLADAQISQGFLEQPVRRLTTRQRLALAAQMRAYAERRL